MKVNPNNSVNIEIKGGSGGLGGGSKKNAVPPSPAASKKVQKITKILVEYHPNFHPD